MFRNPAMMPKSRKIRVNQGVGAEPPIKVVAHGQANKGGRHHGDSDARQKAEGANETRAILSHGYLYTAYNRVGKPELNSIGFSQCQLLSR